MKSKLIYFSAALAAVTLSIVPAMAQVRGPNVDQVRSIHTPVTRINFGQFLLNAGFNATYVQEKGAYKFQQTVTGRQGTFGTWIARDLPANKVGITLSLLLVDNEAEASVIARSLPRKNAIHAPVFFNLAPCNAGENCKYLLSADIWLDLAGLDERAFRAGVNRLVSVAESTRALWDSSSR
jgi:hypothetical protein